MNGLFFELLQIAIGNRKELTRQLTDDEWASMYGICEKQALLGIAFAGVERLPKEQVPVWMRQMVIGACKALNTNYAISATGFAGPTGGTKEIPVGTIWLACGNADRISTVKVEEDHGRDINLAIATNKAMQLFLDYLKGENFEKTEREG